MDTNVFEDLGIVDEAEAPKADLAAISAEAEKVLKLETKISLKKDELKLLERELDDIQERTLVTLMDAAGMKNFTLTNGKRIAIERELYASLPKGRRSEVLNKMRDTYNAGSLIKNELVVTLEKGSDNAAKSLEASAKEMGLEVERTENVHASTYKKFINDRLKSGKEIDLAFFGAYQVTKAIITE